MSNKGLTLVELLVALSISAVILVTVITFYFNGISFWTGGSTRLELQQHARIAAEELVNEMTVASDVCIDRSRQEVRYQKKVGEEELEYRFYLQAEQLLHRLPGGASVPVASFIEKLDFCPDGEVVSGSVISFTLTVSDGKVRIRLRSMVKPRNLH